MAWEQCVDRIHNDIGPDAVVCTDRHCTGLQVSSDYHRSCLCQDWQGRPIEGCNPTEKNLYPYPSAQCYNRATGQADDKVSMDECVNRAKADSNWTWQSCYCCCACLAYGTQIAVPGVGGQQAAVNVEDLRVNQSVLVASLAPTDGGVRVSWSERRVAFSRGTGPDSSETVLLGIAFGDGQTIVVTPDQPFLLPSGKLKRADKLVPGQDSLVLADGGAAAIHEIWAGAHASGVHHIATDVASEEEVTDINGHLLSANGVIIGDFLVQMYQGSAAIQPFVVDDHANLPVVGTPEYAARNAHLEVTHHTIRLLSATAAAPSALAAVETFHPYGRGPMPIPDYADTFINKAQEADIDSTAPKRAFTDTAGVNVVKYLFRLYNGFYPDVRFYLDWENIRPNAFSFEQYGQKIVVVGGGLVRLPDLRMEGLAVILAHELGHLYGGDPGNEYGYACQGQADYFGVGVVLRNVWFGNLWFSIVNPGLEQVQKYFSYISDQNAAGKEQDVCNYPSITCRVQAMQAAIGGGELPTCAGGPTPNGLQLDGADIAADGKTVVVNFNVPVSAYTAEQPQHYSLTPAATVFAAKVQADKSKVALSVALETGTQYELSAMGIYAADGSNLDPDHSTAQVTAPAAAAR